MAIKVKHNGEIKDTKSIYYKLVNGVIVTIKYIYKGSQQVWTSVMEALSCFSSGKWKSTEKWSNSEKWKNNV